MIEVAKHAIFLSRDLSSLRWASMAVKYYFETGQLYDYMLPVLVSSIARRAASLYCAEPLVGVQKYHVMLAIMATVDFLAYQSMSKMSDYHVADVMMIHKVFKMMPGQVMYDSIETRIHQLVKDHRLTCNSLASILVSYAVLQLFPMPNTLEYIYRCISDLRRHMQGVALADIIWALAFLHINMPRRSKNNLFLCIPDVAKEQSSYDISRMIWGMGILSKTPAPPPVMLAIEELAENYFTTKNKESITTTNIVWGCARLGWALRDHLLDKACTQMLNTMETYGSKNLARTCWGLATVSCHVSNRMIAALVDYFIHNVGIFEPPDLCNFTWALSVFGLDRVKERHAIPVMLRHLMMRKVELSKLMISSRMKERFMVQVDEFVACARVLGFTTVYLDRWNPLYKGDSYLSRFRSSIFHSIYQHLMDAQSVSNIEFGVSTPLGLFEIHVVVYFHDGRGDMAIEAAGPSWFCKSSDPTQRKYRGAKTVRRRILEGLGYTYVAIPFDSTQRDIHRILTRIDKKYDGKYDGEGVEELGNEVRACASPCVEDEKDEEVHTQHQIWRSEQANPGCVEEKDEERHAFPSDTR